MTVDLFTAGLALGACALAFLLYRLVNCTDSLEWYDLVATNKKLNAYKIGYWIGAILGSWVIVKLTYLGNLGEGIFGLYLCFIGGVNVANSLTRTMAAGRGNSHFSYSPARDRSADDPDAFGPERGEAGYRKPRDLPRSSLGRRDESPSRRTVKGGRE